MSLSDKYCEGWCKENGGKFEDCTGCEIAELEQELADANETIKGRQEKYMNCFQENTKLKEQVQVAETAMEYLLSIADECQIDQGRVDILGLFDDNGKCK